MGVASINLDRPTRADSKPLRKALAQEHVVRIVIRPGAIDSPPGIGLGHPRGEGILPILELLVEISSQQLDILLMTRGFEFYAHRQQGRKTQNIISPERSFDFGEVCFAEKSSIAGRLEVDPADFHIQGVRLRSNDQVGAIAAQLAVDFVSDVSGHCNHGRRHRDPQRNGDSGEQFAALLPPKGFEKEPTEHVISGNGERRLPPLTPGSPPCRQSPWP